MKRSHLMIAVAFAVSILMASAVAQTGAIKANIPFDFTIEKQTLPAGDYRLSIDGDRLLVARIEGAGAAYVMTNPSGGGPNQDTSSRLVFHRYGNRHFLSLTWIGGRAHELFASPAELEYARTTKQEQEVVLASRMNSK